MRIGCIAIAVVCFLAGAARAEERGGIVLVEGVAANMPAEESSALAAGVARLLRERLGVSFHAVLQADDPLDPGAPGVACFRKRRCAVEAAREHGGESALLVSVVRIAGITKVELFLYSPGEVRSTEFNLTSGDELGDKIPGVIRSLFPSASREDEERAPHERDDRQWTARRTTLWATGAAATASLITSAAFGLRAWSLHSNPSCDELCTKDDQDIRDLESASKKADLFLGIGAGLAVTTAIIAVAWDEDDRSGAPPLSLRAQPAGVTLSWDGTF